MGINNNNPGCRGRVVGYRGKYARYQDKPSSWAYKMCGRWRIKCLQDVQTCGCMVATVQRPPVNHSRCVTTVHSDPTTQYNRIATVLGDTKTQCHAAHGCNCNISCFENANQSH
jgi:hypothetical protein